MLTKGLDVKVLPKLNSCPDSIFMEDISISTSDFAMITNPPLASRNKEKQFVEEHLRAHFGGGNPEFPVFHLAETPEEEATLAFEGGNVIRFGQRHFFVGINRRTNIEGFEKFQKILKRVGKGYSATPVVLLDDTLHLKCFASYLGKRSLIGKAQQIRSYKEFDGIEILDTSTLGNITNVIKVNDHIVINREAPAELEKLLQKRGLKVHRTSNTEFCKVDGDITCRNLLV